MKDIELQPDQSGETIRNEGEPVHITFTEAVEVFRYPPMDANSVIDLSRSPFCDLTPVITKPKRKAHRVNRNA